MMGLVILSDGLKKGSFHSSSQIAFMHLQIIFRIPSVIFG